jgi:hypothetical protein
MFAGGIDNRARRVYVHSTPDADGSNPGSGRHSRRRRGSRASAELVGVLLCAHGDPPCPEIETAVGEFAERRRRALAVIDGVDRRHNVFFDTSAEAARLREGLG